MLLGIGAFILSMMGAFLVRSGVLTSVHAFAIDPKRGVLLLGILGVAAGGALALYAWRAPSLARRGRVHAGQPRGRALPQQHPAGRARPRWC